MSKHCFFRREQQGNFGTALFELDAERVSVLLRRILRTQPSACGNAIWPIDRSAGALSSMLREEEREIRTRLSRYKIRYLDGESRIMTYSIQRALW